MHQLRLPQLRPQRKLPQMHGSTPNGCTPLQSKGLHLFQIQLLQEWRHLHLFPRQLAHTSPQNTNWISTHWVCHCFKPCSNPTHDKKGYNPPRPGQLRFSGNTRTNATNGDKQQQQQHHKTNRPTASSCSGKNYPSTHSHSKTQSQTHFHKGYTFNSR